MNTAAAKVKAAHAPVRAPSRTNVRFAMRLAMRRRKRKTVAQRPPPNGRRAAGVAGGRPNLDRAVQKGKTQKNSEAAKPRGVNPRSGKPPPLGADGWNKGRATPKKKDRRVTPPAQRAASRRRCRRTPQLSPRRAKRQNEPRKRIKNSIH